MARRLAHWPQNEMELTSYIRSIRPSLLSIKLNTLAAFNASRGCVGLFCVCFGSNTLPPTPATPFEHIKTGHKIGNLLCLPL